MSYTINPKLDASDIEGEDLDDFFSALMNDKYGVAYDLEADEIINEVGAIINDGANTTSIAVTQDLDF